MRSVETNLCSLLSLPLFTIKHNSTSDLTDCLKEFPLSPYRDCSVHLVFLFRSCHQLQGTKSSRSSDRSLRSELRCFQTVARKDSEVQHRLSRQIIWKDDDRVSHNN